MSGGGSGETAAASLARVLLACRRTEDARRFAVDSGDPVLLGGLALDAHDFASARAFLDEARRRDPFDPRAASARGRLSFLERRFPESIADLLEAALLRPDGLPDATDARFLRAARALAPEAIPGWKDPAAAAVARLSAAAASIRADIAFPDRSAALVRSLIARSPRAEGVLDRARRLAEIPALADVGDHALLAAASVGELRRLAAGSTLFRAGDAAAEISLVVAGRLELVRETPVGPQPFGSSGAGEFVGEEALVAAPRVADARASEATTLLGFAPDFLLEDPERAPWLKLLRGALARRLSRWNDLFRDFFPVQAASKELPRPSEGAAAALSAEERSRALSSGGLAESDRILFAAFAEERRYPAEAVLFREGDPGDALYAIALGRVRISRRLAGGEEAFAILGPGEIFGEMALLDPEAPGRSADARAHEDAVLLLLSRERFEALERSDPDGCGDLSAVLCRLAARRSVDTAERLARWRVMAGFG
jgi:CRP/FNR family transcriptional regulator, cyclic AMP receptor protein